MDVSRCTRVITELSGFKKNGWDGYVCVRGRFKTYVNSFYFVPSPADRHRPASVRPGPDQAAAFPIPLHLKGSGRESAFFFFLKKISHNDIAPQKLKSLD